MAGTKMLPVGIEDFQKIREQNFYYVDKTGFIKKLLNNWGQVNLFTRPRRFGKTLNMDMLRRFFEIGCDKTLFDGLTIAEEADLCERYMGKFPVIFVSLKDIDGTDFLKAKDILTSLISGEALRHHYLLDSEKLNQYEKICSSPCWKTIWIVER